MPNSWARLIDLSDNARVERLLVQPYRLLGTTPTPREIIELLDLEGTVRRIEIRSLCIMQKTWNYRFVIKIIAGIILAFIVVIMPADIWDAWTVPHEYPFGEEGPAASMWAYRSQQNYLISSISLWTTSTLALWSLLARRARMRTRVLCALPFVVVWALMACDGFRLT